MQRFMLRTGFAVAAVAAVSLAVAADKPKVFPADFGPDTIDVAKFSKELQETYPVFKAKCSQCHTLARPINSAFAGDDWRLYVNQMRHKPNSGINKRAADKIIAFLQYWSAHRAESGWKAPVVSAADLAAAEAAGSATLIKASGPAAAPVAPAAAATATVSK